VKNKRKIINDPVFGFISIPNEDIYDVIQHRYFQRLNRIKQLGISSFVYPGAQHTRFQHSLGAMFLTSEAIKELRLKGHEITQNEANGVMSAILLHDIGHGPYSHLLENTIIQGVRHEKISEILIEKINDELNGTLDLAIKIFKNQYPKKFLHQLISSQLDMDRMDYLRRDSFFTGVVEGEIGSARIIKMLNVFEDKLVIEQKGIHSIENFLMARRFMYWQVYLHKTSIAAEMMLIKILRRAKAMSFAGENLFASPSLQFFLSNEINAGNFLKSDEIIEHFTEIDDSDIISAIKVWARHSDTVLSVLSKNFTERILFKAEESERMTEDKKTELRKKYAAYFTVNQQDADYFFEQKEINNNTYDVKDDNINIMFSDGTVKDISQVSDILTPGILNQDVRKNYLCFLKI
jgi:HD superfamily phosphohydrolase